MVIYFLHHSTIARRRLFFKTKNEVFQQKVWTKTKPRHLWFWKYELFDLPAILTRFTSWILAAVCYGPNFLLKYLIGKRAANFFMAQNYFYEILVLHCLKFRLYLEYIFSVTKTSNEIASRKNAPIVMDLNLGPLVSAFRSQTSNLKQHAVTVVRNYPALLTSTHSVYRPNSYPV